MTNCLTNRRNWFNFLTKPERNYEKIFINIYLLPCLTGSGICYNASDVQQVQNGISCPGADLSGADLSGLNLNGINLRGANLNGARLADTD